MEVTLQPETIMRHHITRAVWLTATFGAPLLQPALAQGRVQREPVRTERELPSLIWASGRDRAVLGVTMGASTRSDTAGVRLEEVDADGPAAKAGLKAGDIVTEINGVSLRVSAADLEDMALVGLAQRRLQRTMAKAKPGDDIQLRVKSGSAAPRAVTVKTVSAAELEGQTRTTSRMRSDDDQRGAIGVSVGSSGSVRDTLGLFVSSVVGGGPVEKAGVIEGERIAAVNGVDVRVPKEDVEDAQATSARVSRFVREVRKVAPGGQVTLRVYGNGRYRDVSVSAVKMSDLPSQGFQMSIGDGGFQVFRGGGPGSALQVLPFGASPRSGEAGPARIRGFMNGQPFEFDSGNLNESMQRLRDRLQELREGYQFEVRSPRGRADSVVRIQTVPRRSITIL